MSLAIIDFFSTLMHDRTFHFTFAVVFHFFFVLHFVVSIYHLKTFGWLDKENGE